MASVERQPPRSVVGILLLDKPAGRTSNQALQFAKRLFRARKAGHTGTLDPMATGMLPVCFGAATKLSGLMLESSKRYRVTARFGVATDTGDATGRPIEYCDAVTPADAEIVEAARGLVGRRQQVPPMYSALKHEGRRLYQLAREGREVSRRARSIEILDLNVESCDWPNLSFDVHCSKGTYVRTLVTDLATELGTVGHVTELRRLAVGPFGQDQMVDVAQLEAAASQSLEVLDRWLLGPDTALLDRPSIEADEVQSRALRQGQAIQVRQVAGPGDFRIYDPGGRFVGLGHLDAAGSLRPTRIFPA